MFSSILRNVRAHVNMCVWAAARGHGSARLSVMVFRVTLSTTTLTETNMVRRDRERERETVR